jgi:hypothetical protein
MTNRTSQLCRVLVSAAPQKSKNAESHMGFDRCVEIPSDALAVKNVAAFCLDGILRDIVAQSAYGNIPLFFAEYPSIVPAADYKIWVAGHLTHTRNQTEDVGIICGCAWSSGVALFMAQDSLLSNVPVSTYVLNCRFASEDRLRYSSFSSGLK